MAKHSVCRWFPVVAALLTLIAFLPALENTWVNWDDDKNFLNNSDWRGLGPAELKWMWTTHTMGHYIPITWMTLGLDHALWGMDALGYHLTSILWHAANAAMFYFLANALFGLAIPATSVETRARLPVGALFAALLFGLHPLRAESVAWITERRDVVSGMFYLLAILAYLRAFQGTFSRRIRRTSYGACLACFTVAVLSKEITVTLPLVLLLLDIYPLRRFEVPLHRWYSGQNRKVLLEKIPFLMIGCAAGALALHTGTHDNLASSLHQVSLFQRLAASLYGLAFYCWKTVAPFHLGPFYALTPHRVDPMGLPFRLSAAVVLALAATAFMLRRKLPALPIACLIYGITLLPVLGIFQNGFQIAADRYSYLACLSWAILAGGGLLALWNVLPRTGRPVAVVLPAVLLCLLGCLTWRQVQIWRDSETLWMKAIAAEPSFIAWNNLGAISEDRHDYPQAVEQYRRALQMNPGYSAARHNLGGALLEEGDWETAAIEFEIALKLSPASASARNGLGYARFKQGRVDDAIQQFRMAVSLDPGSANARNNLEQALAAKAVGR